MSPQAPAQTQIPLEASPTLALQRVALRYGRGPEVLKGVDLTLSDGSFTFLPGQSGAGKSTLLKLGYLALKPSRGLIQLFGQDVALMGAPELQALRRRVGVVLQDFRLIDHLSVFENVALPLRVAGMMRERYVTDVTELLQWVGLGHRIGGRPPRHPRGGRRAQFVPPGAGRATDRVEPA